MSIISRVKGPNADLRTITVEERKSIASQLLQSRHSVQELKAVLGDMNISGLEIDDF
jgi:hypothetical protein